MINILFLTVGLILGMIINYLWEKANQAQSKDFTKKRIIKKEKE